MTFEVITIFSLLTDRGRMGNHQERKERKRRKDRGGKKEKKKSEEKEEGARKGRKSAILSVIVPSLFLIFCEQLELNQLTTARFV